MVLFLHRNIKRRIFENILLTNQIKGQKYCLLTTHLGFLHVIGHTSNPDGLLGLQKKSAYCLQFTQSIQLEFATRIKKKKTKIIFIYNIDEL